MSWISFCDSIQSTPFIATKHPPVGKTSKRYSIVSIVKKKGNPDPKMAETFKVRDWDVDP